ncbi:MAG TPA: hypothetical protein VET27_12955 [Mycobacterium sp.]|nr:hypothetical protein [Mycobacterium sp.]
MNVEERIGALSIYLGHVNPADTSWYLSASPQLMALAAERLHVRFGAGQMCALAPTLQAYFTERLISQRAASPNTIAAYKHTFRLLLDFAARRMRYDLTVVYQSDIPHQRMLDGSFVERSRSLLVRRPERLVQLPLAFRVELESNVEEGVIAHCRHALERSPLRLNRRSGGGKHPNRATRFMSYTQPEGESDPFDNSGP